MRWDYISMTLLAGLGLLLMFIILLQRGRGGGLAGAFGGMGGQSAFGTKAGDVFTKITIVTATIWVVLAGVSGFALRAGSGIFEGGDDVTPPRPEIRAPADPDAPPAQPPAGQQGANPPAAGEAPAGEPPADGEGANATPGAAEKPGDNPPPPQDDAENKTE